MDEKKRERATTTKTDWRVRDHKRVFKSEVFDVCQDALEIEGKDRAYLYVARPPAVIIVPVTSQGEILMVRQYRYPVDEWCMEVPAGGTHDTGDESLQEVARKELHQEIGGIAETWTIIGAFYTSPSLTTERCHIFLAEGVRLTTRPDRETTEEIRIESRRVAEVLQLAREGKMQTAPCALAVLHVRICPSSARIRRHLRGKQKLNTQRGVAVVTR